MKFWVCIDRTAFRWNWNLSKRLCLIVQLSQPYSRLANYTFSKVALPIPIHPILWANVGLIYNDGYEFETIRYHSNRQSDSKGKHDRTDPWKRLKGESVIPALYYLSESSIHRFWRLLLCTTLTIVFLGVIWVLWCFGLVWSCTPAHCKCYSSL